MNQLSVNKTGYVVGIISIGFFLICMAWGILLSSPELKELHLELLQIWYPGFTMSIAGAIIGIIEAFIYGWVLGAAFAWLCKKICR